MRTKDQHCRSCSQDFQLSESRVLNYSKEEARECPVCGCIVVRSKDNPNHWVDWVGSVLADTKTE